MLRQSIHNLVQAHIPPFLEGGVGGISASMESATTFAMSPKSPLTPLQKGGDGNVKRCQKAFELALTTAQTRTPQPQSPRASRANPLLIPPLYPFGAHDHG